MNRYEMLKQSIELKIQRNAKTDSFVELTKKQIAVFQQAKKLTEEEAAELLAMLEA